MSSQNYLPHQQSNNGNVKPLETYPYQDGASDPRASAIAYRNGLAEQQNNNINSFGGKKMRKHRGGTGLVVPSFGNIGPAVSPNNANVGSIAANTTNTQSISYSTCDSCIGPEASASQLCQSSECNPQSGGSSNSIASLLMGPNETLDSMYGGKRRRLRSKSKKSNKSKI